MKSEAKISISSFIFKIFVFIGLIISGYFIYTSVSNFLGSVNNKFESSDVNQTYKGINDFLNDIINLLKENLKWFIILGFSLLGAILTWILDVIVLSFAPWKTNKFGKTILFLSTIFPLFPIFWIISIIGNLAIIANKNSYKKRVKQNE
ncbi:hypothetical protein ACWXVO_02525 [Mycoplasma sp. 1890]